jgi:hypothetical protein
MALTKRDLTNLFVTGIIILVGFGTAFGVRFVYRDEIRQLLDSLLGDNLLLTSLIGLGVSGFGFVVFLRAGKKVERSEYSLNTVRAVFFGLVFVVMLFSLIVASVI